MSRQESRHEARGLERRFLSIVRRSGLVSIMVMLALLYVRFIALGEPLMRTQQTALVAAMTAVI